MVSLKWKLTFRLVSAVDRQPDILDTEEVACGQDSVGFYQLQKSLKTEVHVNRVTGNNYGRSVACCLSQCSLPRITTTMYDGDKALGCHSVLPPAFLSDRRLCVCKQCHMSFCASL
jgi:hypothetical protein